MTRGENVPCKESALLMEAWLGISGYRGILSGYMRFPGGSDGKESACNAGDLGSISGFGKIPWRRKWQPTPAFLPGESQGRRSLVGCRLWGRTESDMTEAT